MRLLLLFLVVTLFAVAKDDINLKIKDTSSKLQTYNESYQNINKKMAETAEAILVQRSELDKQEMFLEELKVELSLKEQNYGKNISQLAEMKKAQDSLKSKQEVLEEQLVYVIAKTISLSMILNENNSESEDSLIEVEVLQVMLDKSKEKADILSKEFVNNSQEIDILSKNTTYLEQEISSIDQKRKQLLATQTANIKALEKLTAAKESYKNELKALLGRQNALKDTLAQLNIIKIDQIKKAKEEEERKIAFEKQKILPDEKLPKVKKHGSSYQAVQTKKYTGKKTIAPLDSYTVTKEYGTYTDPIYGIKIFNESISLKPKEADAKVKTVFNGKVIYADKTAVLDNIVIVEHSNGLHTIYANLSQISPDIKKGLKVKKGYTIGRVTDELVFEVTQKSYHIDPIQLFK